MFFSIFAPFFFLSFSFFIKESGEAIFSAASGCIWAGLVFGGFKFGFGMGFLYWKGLFAGRLGVLEVYGSQCWLLSYAQQVIGIDPEIHYERNHLGRDCRSLNSNLNF